MLRLYRWSVSDRMRDQYHKQYFNRGRLDVIIFLVGRVPPTSRDTHSLDTIDPLRYRWGFCRWTFTHFLVGMFV